MHDCVFRVSPCCICMYVHMYVCAHVNHACHVYTTLCLSLCVCGLCLCACEYVCVCMYRYRPDFQFRELGRLPSDDSERHSAAMSGGSWAEDKKGGGGRAEDKKGGERGEHR